MESDCLYPNHSPVSAYNKGCRCSNCKRVKKEISKKYYDSDKERYCEYSRKFLRKRKVIGKYWAWKKEKSAKERARSYGCEISTDLVERRRMREIYEECVKISEETGIKHVVDHIIPLSRGGRHHPDNLQILTEKQNLKKGSKIL